MDRQLVYRRRLLRAHGALARVRPRGETSGAPITGLWAVDAGGRFYLRPSPEAADTLAALAQGPWGVCADIQLDLPTGVHSFVAIIRRAAGPRAWEIVPHPRVDVREGRAHVRVSGPISALLDRRDGSAWEPAVLEDLAVDGVAFRCGADLPPGAHAALRWGPTPPGPLDVLPIEIVRRALASDGAHRYGARFWGLGPRAIAQVLDVLIGTQTARRLPGGA